MHVVVLVAAVSAHHRRLPGERGLDEVRNRAWHRLAGAVHRREAKDRRRRARGFAEELHRLLRCELRDRVRRLRTWRLRLVHRDRPRPSVDADRAREDDVARLLLGGAEEPDEWCDIAGELFGKPPRRRQRRGHRVSEEHECVGVRERRPEDVLIVERVRAAQESHGTGMHEGRGVARLAGRRTDERDVEARADHAREKMSSDEATAAGHDDTHALAS